MLTVRPVAAPRGRLLAARGVLWLAVGACLLALGLVRRALAREARAVAREKAFVAGVTHELRTPVTAIRVFGETLAEGRGDAREYGTLVAEESERLEALVERVLAATRLDEAPRLVRGTARGIDGFRGTSDATACRASGRDAEPARQGGPG